MFIDNKERNITDLYSRYAPMVLRRCRKLLRDEDLALDAMQEVFVKVLSKDYYKKIEYPSSLLYRIATNICLNLIRSNQKYEDSAPEIIENIAVNENKESREVNQSMLNYIFKYEKESTRDMAVMFYVDGFTLNEIADVFALSLSGVRKRLRLLKERISKEGLHYEAR